MSQIQYGPEADDTMSGSDRLRYCAAFLVFALLWMGGLAIVSGALLPQHLKDIFGQGRTYNDIFTWLNAATALASLVSNLVVGNLSDRTRSRFGRRTPWIIAGGVIGGVTLFLVGVFTNAWVIGIMYCLCMVGLNMMIAPVIASMSDRVPENMRATMSAFMSMGTTIGNSLGVIVGTRFLTMQIPGFVIAGILMGIAGICTCLVWPQEKSAADLPPVKGGLKDLARSFILPTKGARDFWLAFAGRTLLIFSYYMVCNFQLYILEDYIGLEKKVAGDQLAWMSVLVMIFGLIGSLGSGFISDRFGRRKTPVIVASLLMAIGFLLPWIMHNTVSMYLFAVFAGFGYAVYGAVDQALNIDVLPDKEKSGKDLGILNMATTLGQMIGPVVTGILIKSVFGYGLVFPVAILFAILACVFIQMITVTE